MTASSCLHATTAFVLQLATARFLSEPNVRTPAPDTCGSATVTDYKLSRSSGTITARLLKSTDPDFPCYLDPPLGLGLIQKQQQVARLPAMPPDLDEGRWGFFMMEMFTHEQNAAMVRSGCVA